MSEQMAQIDRPIWWEDNLALFHDWSRSMFSLQSHHTQLCPSGQYSVIIESGRMIVNPAVNQQQKKIFVCVCVYV